MSALLYAAIAAALLGIKALDSAPKRCQGQTDTFEQSICQEWK